jgi:hypothetical protein
MSSTTLIKLYKGSLLFSFLDEYVYLFSYNLYFICGFFYLLRKLFAGFYFL